MNNLHELLFMWKKEIREIEQEVKRIRGLGYFDEVGNLLVEQAVYEKHVEELERALSHG